MKRTKRRQTAVLALSVLGLTLIAPWVFGQDPDPITEIRRCARERVSLGKEHSEAVRGIESKAGEFYREGLKGSEKRAREAARSNGLLLSYGSRPVDWYRINELKHSVSEERLEQVREIDGEQAYEKMRRAVEKASQEKASQEKARQVERARLEWARQETARQSRERRGPERGGPERDFGPSR